VGRCPRPPQRATSPPGRGCGGQRMAAANWSWWAVHQRADGSADHGPRDTSARRSVTDPPLKAPGGRTPPPTNQQRTSPLANNHTCRHDTSYCGQINLISDSDPPTDTPPDARQVVQWLRQCLLSLATRCAGRGLAYAAMSRRRVRISSGRPASSSHLPPRRTRAHVRNPTGRHGARRRRQCRPLAFLARRCSGPRPLSG
jgi:hypothetical protein